MRMYEGKGRKLVVADAVKKPQFKHYFGRAWQEAKVTVDGKKVESAVDATWGHWVYFRTGERWYKVDVRDIPCDAFDAIELFTKECDA